MKLQNLPEALKNSQISVKFYEYADILYSRNNTTNIKFNNKKTTRDILCNLAQTPLAPSICSFIIRYAVCMH